MSENRLLSVEREIRNMPGGSQIPDKMSEEQQAALIAKQQQGSKRLISTVKGIAETRLREAESEMKVSQERELIEKRREFMGKHSPELEQKVLKLKESSLTISDSDWQKVVDRLAFKTIQEQIQKISLEPTVLTASPENVLQAEVKSLETLDTPKVVTIENSNSHSQEDIIKALTDIKNDVENIKDGSVSNDQYNKILENIKIVLPENKVIEAIQEKPKSQDKVDLKDVKTLLNKVGKALQEEYKVEVEAEKQPTKIQKLAKDVCQSISKALHKIVGKEQEYKAKQEKAEIKTEQKRTMSFVDKILAERGQKQRGNSMGL